jgi:hypothetical protein
MKKLYKVLIGIAVAFALMIPLGMVAGSATPARVSIVRVADNFPPTPTPQFGQCHGQGC